LDANELAAHLLKVFLGLALKRKGESTKKRNLIIIEKEDCNKDKIK
jgi:hypothetical protein